MQSEEHTVASAGHCLLETQAFEVDVRLTLRLDFYYRFISKAHGCAGRGRLTAL